MLHTWTKPFPAKFVTNGLHNFTCFVFLPSTHYSTISTIENNTLLNDCDSRVVKHESLNLLLSSWWCLKWLPSLFLSRTNQINVKVLCCCWGFFFLSVVLSVFQHFSWISHMLLLLDHIKYWTDNLWKNSNQLQKDWPYWSARLSAKSSLMPEKIALSQYVKLFNTSKTQQQLW